MNIVDAWNELRAAINENAYIVNIDRGSFAGGVVRRQQIKSVFCWIDQPLDFLTLPKDITPTLLEDYYNKYILSDEVAPNQSYTYGERISLQLPHVMEMLRTTPYTNQAAISVSQPSDIFLTDPPCLREITFKILPEYGLVLTSYWRSNDLDNAFLWNQGSLALLLRDVAYYAGVNPCQLVYFSDGLHRYLHTTTSPR